VQLWLDRAINAMLSMPYQCVYAFLYSNVNYRQFNWINILKSNKF